MKTTDLKNKNWRKVKWLITYMTVAVSAVLMSMTVFADSTTAALDSMTNLIDIIILIVRLVGVGFAVFGIYEFATAMASRDASQRGTGIMCSGAGLLMIFGKELLNAIGVTW